MTMRRTWRTLQGACRHRYALQPLPAVGTWVGSLTRMHALVARALGAAAAAVVWALALVCPQSPHDVQPLHPSSHAYAPPTHQVLTLQAPSTVNFESIRPVTRPRDSGIAAPASLLAASSAEVASRLNSGGLVLATAVPAPSRHLGTILNCQAHSCVVVV
jgi:hypothetical protein